MHIVGKLDIAIDPVARYEPESKMRDFNLSYIHDRIRHLNSSMLRDWDTYPVLVSNYEASNWGDLKSAEQAILIQSYQQQSIPRGLSINNHHIYSDRSAIVQNKPRRPLSVDLMTQPSASKPKTASLSNISDQILPSSAPATATCLSTISATTSQTVPADFRAALLTPTPDHFRRHQGLPALSSAMTDSYAAHLLAPRSAIRPRSPASADSEGPRKRPRSHSGPDGSAICPASTATRISVENLLG